MQSFRNSVKRSDSSDHDDEDDRKVNGKSIQNVVERIQILEKELEKAKESERLMQESLVAQSGQLEQARISLDEAKQEMIRLEEHNRCLNTVRSNADGTILTRNFRTRKISFADPNAAGVGIGVLKYDVGLAAEADAKRKKAIAEAREAKERLAATQAELENVRLEAERLRASIETNEEKRRLLCEETERLKREAEEATLAWEAKEREFIDGMKMLEKENNETNRDNAKLRESQRVISEENGRLRELLKQAVDECRALQESLELTRAQNSELMSLLSEKENALMSLRQEYECLKVSEAASQDSLEELRRMLQAMCEVEHNPKESSPTDVQVIEVTVVSSDRGNDGDEVPVVAATDTAMTAAELRTGAAASRSSKKGGGKMKKQPIIQKMLGVFKRSKPARKT